jgi:hypothetical protein
MQLERSYTNRKTAVLMGLASLLSDLVSSRVECSVDLLSGVPILLEDDVSQFGLSVGCI